MYRQLYFITGNKNKIIEARDFLMPDITLLNDSLDIFISEAEETGKSYQENAYLKLKNAKKYLSQNCFSEDSGLEIESLDNRPGIFSARYAKTQKSELTNIEHIMSEMIGKTNRKAKFVACIALSLSNKIYFFQSQIEGVISDHISTKTQGFGYDPIFIPVGYDKTFAELPIEIKQNISHRAGALRKLKKFIISLSS